MKATELRIGNYINLIGSRQGIVLEVRTNHARIKYELEGKEKQSHVEYENLEPIPLTEEWLLRLGFKQEECFYLLNGVCLEDEEDGKYRLEGQGGCTFQYVHQLQNLYFSLTREEMEVKHEPR